jgi:hypothetical protein
MKRFGITAVLLATLVLVSPSAGEAQVLQPEELCSDYTDAAIATFEDASLEARIRATAPWNQKDLTCGQVSRREDLDARPRGTPVSPDGDTGRRLSRRIVAPITPIESLVGIQNLTGLTSLALNGNAITDISALSGLTRLTSLRLNGNAITDISALSGLTRLTNLRLSGNAITDISALSGLTRLTNLYLNDNPSLSDIQPLLDNVDNGGLEPRYVRTQVGPWGSSPSQIRMRDMVHLENTNVGCTDVAALEAKGVSVTSDCR